MKETLLRGLKITLPVLLTFLLVYWALVTVESVFRAIIEPFFPKSWYFPGLGALVGLIVIFCVGLSFNAWMVANLQRWMEKLIHRIPIVNSVYQSIQDFMGMLDTKNTAYGTPVFIEFQGAKLIGLVTRRSLHEIKQCSDQEVAVYLPMSYQLGGYTVLLPADRITPLDMSVQDAMKFILTAGITRSKQEQKKD